MLGFAKGFIIFLFLSVIIGLGTQSVVNGLTVMGVFIVIKVIVKILS
jgi:hypothetical protein